MMNEKYEALKLENHLCFPLYACARETIKKYKPFLDQMDLTYTQYIAMTALWEKRQLTVKEMGAMLYLDSGTLTPLLKKLEGKKLIQRKRSDEDERNLLVSLTEKGAQLRDVAMENCRKTPQQFILSPEEARQLYRILYKLLDGLSRNTEEKE